MKQNDKKLVGYITSSLPNNNFTIDLAYSMKEAGVDYTYNSVYELTYTAVKKMLK